MEAAAASRISTHAPGRLWWSAVGILIAALLAELLPLLFGVGESATWDWSFTYITLHFLLLPIASVVHILVSVLLAFALARANRSREIVVPLASCLIPLCYLLIVRVYPLFWFVRG